MTAVEGQTCHYLVILSSDPMRQQLCSWVYVPQISQYIHMGPCVKMFIPAFFMVAEKWKQDQ